MNISFAITAHNEHRELKTLLQQLASIGDKDDEVVIQLDSTYTKEVMDVVNEYKALFEYPYSYHIFPLNGDFAAFKNHLKELCSKKMILNLDADEYMSDILAENIHFIVDNNEIDLYGFPRKNIVKEITSEYLEERGWYKDEKERINWPDIQFRLFANKPEIRWVGKVHEKLVGWGNIAVFPNDDESWALIHIKEFQRQKEQNELYDKISK